MASTMDSKAVECKSLITGLLVSSTSRVSIPDLCNDFYSIVGYSIPFRELGFSNVEQYLRSIPDTVRIIGTGMTATVIPVIKSNIAHINEMVLRQKKAPQKRIHNSANRISYYNHARGSGRAPQRFQDRRHVRPIMSFPVSYPPKAISNHSTIYNNSNVDNKAPSPVPQMNGNDDNVFPQPSSYASSLKTNLPTGDTKNVNASQDIRPILKKPEANVKMNLKPPLPTSCSDEDFDIARQILDQKSTPIIIDDTHYCNVPKQIQDNLIKVVSNFPEGILCSKIPQQYKNLVGRGLHYERYRYRSLIEMISDLPEILHYVKSSSADYLVFDKNVPLPCTRPLTDLVNREAPPTSENLVTVSILEEIGDIDLVTANLLLPPDMMGPNDVIPRYFIQDEKKGDYLDINIAEIYDPSKFWIYLRLGPLDNLMKELQTHFSDPRHLITIPDRLLVEGFHCAAPYFQDFHRAVIVDTLPQEPEEVKVYYIDYGTVGYVKQEQIYFLPKCFGETPSQAIRARLSNIYPPVESAPWSVECTNRFKQMTDNRFLIAEIIKIDEENLVLEVYLVDITTKTNITFVNDRLANEGLAKFIGQERKKPLYDKNLICLEEYIHLFPDFEEIEHGMAPTSEEMCYLIKNDISIDHYYPQYYNRISCEDVEYIDKIQKELHSNCTGMKSIKGVSFNQEFDYSLFPASMVKEIKIIAKDLSRKESEKESKKTKNNESGESKNDVKNTEDAIKIDPQLLRKSTTVSGHCNRKRIEEFLKPKVEPKKEETVLPPIQNQSIDSLSDLNPFKRMSLDDLPTTFATKRNPFLISDSDTISEESPAAPSFRNPFKNPFISTSDMDVSSDVTIDSPNKTNSLTPPLSMEIVKCDRPKVGPPPGFSAISNFHAPMQQRPNAWNTTVNYNNFYCNGWNMNVDQQMRQQFCGPYNNQFSPQMHPYPQMGMGGMPMNFPAGPMMPPNFQFNGRPAEMQPNFWQNNQGPFYPRNQ